MADYRELLRRAIDALPENNGTSRRAVYEKARSALVTQLRAIDPPLPAREITQHRLTLEDCIRQVEQEATEKLLRGLQQPNEPPAPAPVPSAPQSVEPEPMQEELQANETDEVVSEEQPQEAFVAQEPEPVVEPEPEVIAEPEPVVEAEEPVSEPEAEVEPLDEPGDNFGDDLAAAVSEVSSQDDEDDKLFAPSEETTVVDDAPALIEADAAELAPGVAKAEKEVEAPSTASVSEDDEPDILIEADEEPSFEEIKAEDAPQHDPEEDQVAIAPVDEPKMDAAPSIAPQEASPQADEPKIEIGSNADAPLVETSPAVSIAAASAAIPATKSPTIDPVADVIAAAQAASAAPKIEPVPSISHDDAPDDIVAPALSKVVEVEVEDHPKDGDGEEPQATIDRAIKALDLEAEGKDGSGLIAEEKAKSDETKADDKAKTEPPAEVVEDEQVGGNGLTVFLLTAVLLLGGATGGAYWAWKEGFIDLEPLVAQLGLSGGSTNTPTVSQSTDGSSGNQTSTNTDVPTSANVRDVTPNSSSTNTNTNTDTSTTVPDNSASGTDRLTAEPQTDTITETPADNSSTTDTATAQTETPSIGENANVEGGDRLQAEDPSANTDSPVLNTEDTTNQPTQVGSRSMLIEEQLAGSGGAVPFTGETTWSRDVDELGVPTIKATVTIPARNLSVDVLIRKNSDAALPASHMVEVNFEVTESFLGGGIASMPGILLKNEELAQGSPLIGASVRIIDNSFLFALSDAEGDLATNLAMLSERGWIDLPVVYSTGRKAIVTLEKGADGQSIFEAVLASWTAQ